MPEMCWRRRQTVACWDPGLGECCPRLGQIVGEPRAPPWDSQAHFTSVLLVCALVGLFQLMFSVIGTHVELFLSSCKTDSVLG